MIATLRVKARGVANRLRGYGDPTGLTVPCTGCESTDPHDAHLAPGALDHLGRHSR